MNELHVTLMCVCDFVKILTQGRTSLMGMNAISFTRVPWKFMTVLT